MAQQIEQEQQDTELVAFAAACKKASRVVAGLDGAAKDRLLRDMADRLVASEVDILAANGIDMDNARENGLSSAMIDRLALSTERIAGMADALREVAALPDPVGEVTRMWRRPNGIEVGRVRIPLGVICMIYESRPNVTVDAAGLCLKAGNGVILRGGKEAFHTNHALAAVLRAVLNEHGVPGEAVSLVPTTDRAAMNTLLTLESLIDLVIPRGGEGLIRYVAKTSQIPVIKHYKGVCHLYVHADAEIDMALNLLIDGKASRPGVCNALETLLVHRDIAPRFLERAGALLREKGVTVRGCAETRDLLPWAEPADEADYDAEFLDLILAVRVVDDYDAAVAHIHRFGSDHTEVICTRDYRVSRAFVRDVNASVVMVNASSRFSDGGQLGLGAEIGISTTRLHAYGPMGLVSLTTQKFVVFGDGQTRHRAAIESK